MCTIFANLLQLGPNIGDSGSWVVDEQSYGVYGHLVASDALGEIYVVPFDQILLDIKHTLGAVSISLPSQSDISLRRGGYYSPFIGDGLSGHMLDSGHGSENPSPPGLTERALSGLLGSIMVDDPEQAHLRGTSGITVVEEPVQPSLPPSLPPSEQPSEQPSFSGTTVVEELGQPILKKASISIEPTQSVLKRRSKFRRHLKSVFRKVYKPRAESNP